MLAARLYGRKDLRIESVVEPTPTADQVKIKVAHNGICGTDLHEYFAGPSLVSHVPNPLTGAALPQITGHEFAGTVVETGRNVHDLVVGARVCVEPVMPCRRCSLCTQGLGNLCRQVASHGLSSPGGGLSEFTVVPRRNVHLLPEKLTLIQGALVEPLCVGSYAVARSKMSVGQSAVVLGAGPIGLGLFLALQADGIAEVTVVEPSLRRRQTIAELGAVSIIDPNSTDVASEVLDRTNGRGVDVVFDCAGNPAAFETSTKYIAARGKLVVAALFERPVSLDPFRFFMKEEIDIMGCHAYTSDTFEAVIMHMANGAYPLDGWVTNVPFEDLVGVGMELLRRQDAVKVLIDLPS